MVFFYFDKIQIVLCNNAFLRLSLFCFPKRGDHGKINR
jgi:hypothetical protein